MIGPEDSSINFENSILRGQPSKMRCTSSLGIKYQLLQSIYVLFYMYLFLVFEISYMYNVHTVCVQGRMRAQYINFITYTVFNIVAMSSNTVTMFLTALLLQCRSFRDDICTLYSKEPAVEKRKMFQIKICKIVQ